MAGIGGALDVPELRGARLLLVEARYHASIADMLLDGARAMLDRGHCTCQKQEELQDVGPYHGPKPTGHNVGRGDGCHRYD